MWLFWLASIITSPSPVCFYVCLSTRLSVTLLCWSALKADTHVYWNALIRWRVKHCSKLSIFWHTWQSFLSDFTQLKKTSSKFKTFNLVYDTCTRTVSSKINLSEEYRKAPSDWCCDLPNCNVVVSLAALNRFNRSSISTYVTIVSGQRWCHLKVFHPSNIPELNASIVSTSLTENPVINSTYLRRFSSFTIHLTW